MISERTPLIRLFWLAAALVLPPAQHAHADMVTDWNQIAIRSTEIASASVPLQTRALSLVHGAMFDAVNAIAQRYAPYAIDVHAPRDLSAEAAAAAAAHGILERLYPLQKAIVDAELANSLAKIPEGLPKTEGLRLGEQVAGRLFELRRDDGASAKQTYTFSSGPGVYQATPPMNAMPIVPHWRAVKPFLMTAAHARFAGPPAITGAQFAKDFDEVKRLGSKASTERTNEQTAIAIHWAGSEVPPLNTVARAAAAAKGMSLVESARLFALLNMAMADSLIAGFDAKYRFNFWRPVTAIRNAGLANNPALVVDTNWDPLLITPPHPEYPSAHCLGAGAAVAVLQNTFEGDKLATSYIYPPLGTLRRWDSFSQIAKEIENARVWGGIHYRTSVEHGTQIGREIAESILKSQLQPRTKS